MCPRNLFIALLLTCLSYSQSEGQDLMVFCPESTEVETSELTQFDIDIQLAVNAAFADWIDGFRSSSTCTITATDISGFSAPPSAGGSVTITYRATDSCGGDEVCTATFTVIGDPATTIILNCPEDVVLTECNSQAKIDSAFSAWTASFTFIAPPGSNVIATDLSVERAPACGTSKTITFIVEDLSNPAITPVECTRTFVLPPSALLNPLAGIPTMGEWGVIALVLVLLSIAVVSLKSRIPAKAQS